MKKSWLPIAAIALFAAACNEPASTGESETTQAAADDPVSRLSDATAAYAALSGGWYSPSTEALWTFKPDGYITISEASSGYNWAILRYSGDDAMIEVIDVSSPPVAGANAGCAHENKGAFGYAVDGDSLTLTRLEDPCDVRGSRLDGLQFERIETPLQPGAPAPD